MAAALDSILTGGMTAVMKLTQIVIARLKLGLPSMDFP
jgi:hypothetical protein